MFRTTGAGALAESQVVNKLRWTNVAWSHTWQTNERTSKHYGQVCLQEQRLNKTVSDSCCAEFTVGSETCTWRNNRTTSLSVPVRTFYEYGKNTDAGLKTVR